MFTKDQSISIISGARGCSWNCGKSYYEGRERRKETLVLPCEIETYKEKYGNYGVIKER